MEEEIFGISQGPNLWILKLLWHPKSKASASPRCKDWRGNLALQFSRLHHGSFWNIKKPQKPQRCLPPTHGGVLLLKESFKHTFSLMCTEKAHPQNSLECSKHQHSAIRMFCSETCWITRCGNSGLANWALNTWNEWVAFISVPKSGSLHSAGFSLLLSCTACYFKMIICKRGCGTITEAYPAFVYSQHLNQYIL